MARARARSVDSTDDQVSSFAKAEAEPDYFMTYLSFSAVCRVHKLISQTVRHVCQ